MTRIDLLYFKKSSNEDSLVCSSENSPKASPLRKIAQVKPSSEQSSAKGDGPKEFENRANDKSSSSSGKGSPKN